MKWQDVDWEREFCTRMIRRLPARFVSPHSHCPVGPFRNVLFTLTVWVLAKLKDLKQSQTENPVVEPEEWHESVDLIFVTEFGRPVNVNSLVYKHFKPILKKAGLPNIRLYDLRHTAATLA
jgi:integrase